MNNVTKKEQTLATLQELHEQKKSIFATSSFQSHSIPLLHILSELPFQIPIYFVNTGFLFPETLDFKDTIAEQFKMDIREASSTVSKIHQLNQHGNFHFTDDPERCCFINKLEPVQQLLPRFDIWISGVRRDQTENRKNLETFQPAPHNCMRFHPMLDWSQADIEEYIREHHLPQHPLNEQGFQSIGCQPCTEKTDDRQGRWSGLRKTECGLHTNLAIKNTQNSR